MHEFIIQNSYAINKAIKILLRFKNNTIFRKTNVQLDKIFIKTTQ